MSDAQKHTPGPWDATLVMGPQSAPRDERRTPDHYLIGECGIGKPGHLANIAHVVGADAISEANARLIAAAPSLLEALEDILRACDDCEDHRHGWRAPECADPRHAAARAAIQAATGEVA